MGYALVMEFFIRAMGAKRKITQFRNLAAAARNEFPALEAIKELLFEIEEATFRGQGRRGGGSWKQLTDAWLTRKLRNGLDPRINIATGALLASVTEEGAEGQIIEIDRTTLIFGSSLPQAGPSQKYRPFIKLLPNDVARMRVIIREHLVAGWNA
jgi:hypothetical protein